MTFVLLIAGIIFLFGLVQWARSGAILWDIHTLLSKSGVADKTEADGSGSETIRAKENLEKSIRRMEGTMDGFLKSSLRILSILAACVWFFALASIVMDMLHLDWMDRLSFTANRILGNPTMRAGFNTTRTGGSSSVRDNAFRSIGSGVRR